MALNAEQKAALHQIKSGFDKDFVINILAGLSNSKAYLKACRKHKKRPSATPKNSGFKISKKATVSFFLGLMKNDTQSDPQTDTQNGTHKKDKNVTPITPALKIVDGKVTPKKAPKKGKKATDQVPDDFEPIETYISKIENITDDREKKRVGLMHLAEMKMKVIEDMVNNPKDSRPIPSGADIVSAYAELNRMDDDHKIPEAEKSRFTPVPIQIVDAS